MMIWKAWEGFAPVAALLAMVLIGAGVTGGFYVVTHERRAARADLVLQAYEVAEVGLQDALEQRGLPEGEAAPVTVYRSATGEALATYTIHVRRAGPNLTLVKSEGRVKSGEAEVARTVSTLISTVGTAPSADSAAATRGLVKAVDGHTAVPPPTGLAGIGASR